MWVNKIIFAPGGPPGSRKYALRDLFRMSGMAKKDGKWVMRLWMASGQDRNGGVIPC